METLISMTSFVKKVLNEDRPCDRGKMLDEIGNYAEFLSQPLTLGMFVPCDLEGIPLQKPKESDYENGICPHESYQYEQALERVLFHIEIPINVETIKYHFSINRDIEYLANKDFPKIKLTETAKKQIGL